MVAQVVLSAWRPAPGLFCVAARRSTGSVARRLLWFACPRGRSIQTSLVAVGVVVVATRQAGADFANGPPLVVQSR